MFTRFRSIAAQRRQFDHVLLPKGGSLTQHCCPQEAVWLSIVTNRIQFDSVLLLKGVSLTQYCFAQEAVWLSIVSHRRQFDSVLLPLVGSLTQYCWAQEAVWLSIVALGRQFDSVLLPTSSVAHRMQFDSVRYCCPKETFCTDFVPAALKFAKMYCTCVLSYRECMYLCI